MTAPYLTPPDATFVPRPEPPQLPQPILRAVQALAASRFRPASPLDARVLETGGSLGVEGYGLRKILYDLAHARGAFQPSRPAGALADFLEVPGLVRGATSMYDLTREGHPVAGALVGMASVVPGAGGAARGAARDVARTAGREAAESAARDVAGLVRQSGMAESATPLRLLSPAGSVSGDAHNFVPIHSPRGDATPVNLGAVTDMSSQPPAGRLLYHVAPPSYKQGSPLYSGADYERITGKRVRNKWEGDFKDYRNSQDFREIAFHDNLADAIDFNLGTFGGRGKVIEVEAPHGARVGKNPEGYPTWRMGEIGVSEDLTPTGSPWIRRILSAQDIRQSHVDADALYSKYGITPPKGR